MNGASGICRKGTKGQNRQQLHALDSTWNADGSLPAHSPRALYLSSPPAAVAFWELCVPGPVPCYLKVTRELSCVSSFIPSELSTLCLLFEPMVYMCLAFPLVVIKHIFT